MTVNVTEYMNKFQEEGLDAIKQTQEASLDAMRSFREFGKEFSEKPGTLPTFENLPSPTQFVEMSFGFASQLLEIRKSYTMKVAEMIVEAQKQVQVEHERPKRRLPTAAPAYKAARQVTALLKRRRIGVPLDRPAKPGGLFFCSWKAG